MAIAHHRALKVRGHRTLPQTMLTDTTAAPDPALLDILEGDTEQQQLTVALHALPTKQRETLELVFYHELSGREAAQVLGVPSGTIKSRLHRALVTLRRVLSVKDVHSGLSLTRIAKGHGRQECRPYLKRIHRRDAIFGGRQNHVYPLKRKS